MSADVYQQLCANMMAPGSARLARIWEMLCDPTDAALLLAMPGTLAELAGKTGLSAEEAQRRLALLFHKGVVFTADKPAGTVYRGPRHIVQMHDASVQWPGTVTAFYDLWKEFMNEEYPGLVAMMLAAGIPSFMRVIPTTAALADLPDVLPHENVRQMIAETEDIAICRCPCRLTERDCNTTLETCIQFNRGAQYNLKRGTGRRIGKDEALAIVLQAEKNGLVHTVENRPETGNVLCNCCSCCCAIIKPYRRGPEMHAILAPSRFRATVDEEKCIADGLCVEICPFQAITQAGEAEPALVDKDQCLGCGLCVSVCPSRAVTLHALP